MNNKSLGMLEKYFDAAFDSPNGIKELRNLILKLAMKGKLVPQDPNDQPASELVKEIKIKKNILIKNKELKEGQVTKDSKKILNNSIFPSSWEFVKSNEIFFITKLAGFEYTKHIKLKDYGEIPVIRAQNVRPYNIDETILKYIDYETSSKLERCALTMECLLMTFIGAGIGDVAKFNKAERWHLAPNVAKIEPIKDCNRKINLDFFLFYLNSFYGKNEIFKHLKSTAQPSISMGTIRDIDIPIPPLNEQKRIVTKINELMTRCDEMERLKQEQIEKQIKTNTSVVHQMMESRNNNNFKSNLSFITNNFSSLYIAKKNVEGLKKSILQLAMKGKLVPQDPNDQPATELLKKIQIEKEKLISEGKIKKQKASPEIKPGKTPYKLPEGWIWCRLGDIGLIGSSSRVLQKDWRTKGIPFYRAREIVMLHKQGRVNNSLFIDEDLYIHLGKKGMLPESDDIMLTAVGTIGVPYIVTTKDRFYFKDASVLIFKNYFKMPAVFLKNFFISPFWINNIHKNSMGTTVHTLTITRAKATLFPLPPLNEQKRIVKKINELMALCDNIIDKIDLSEEKREKLLQSVLAKV